MLPANRDTSKFHRKEDLPTPGSYWRFKGELDSDGCFHGRAVPDHGLVLLVKEVRVVDGDIHTLVMKSHPSWNYGDPFNIKILANEFLKDWSPELDWEAIREREIAEVHDRIGEATKRIQAGPEQEALNLLIAEQREKREATDDKAATKSKASHPNVPAVLLPSGDVFATQKRIETGLDLANAQAAFIQSQTNKIQAEMKIMISFQSEKSDQALASVSHAQAQAKGLLDNVRTMRLFLGEDCETHTLKTGKAAPSDEPLTLMQRLLYLDEEIFIEGQFDEGFDFKAMGNIDEIFSDHPQIIERMMPYERCVVLARVRRNRVPVHEDVKMTVSEFFAICEEQELNQRVFLFIRNGENVHMVVADEQTSQAKRLFPSADEINDIFTTKFDGKREITVKDIEYSYAREKHDDRALHYKRFLLLLWGLHERESLLGDFMPKGQNWLTESVHNECFRFVHDEEGVLEDGMPTLSNFIKSANESMTEGSRIAVNWMQAVDEYSAPQIYDRTYRTVDLVKAIEVTTLEGDELGKLTAKCLTQKAWQSQPKQRNATICIRKYERRGPVEIDGRTEYPLQPSYTYGTVCLDYVSLDEIHYYMNSRAARVQYLNYIHMFAEARRVLASEKNSVSQATTELLDKNAQASASMIKDAVTLWRKSKKWILPETEAHMKAIQKIVTAMIKSRDLQRPEIIEIQVNAKGEVIEIEPVDTNLIPGFDLGFVTARTFKVATQGKLNEIKSETVLRSLTRPSKSSIQVWIRDDISNFMCASEIKTVRDNLSFVSAGTHLEEMATRLNSYVNSSHLVIGGGSLSEVFADIDVETADNLMKEFKRYVFSDKRPYMPSDTVCHPLGLVAVTPDKNKGRNGSYLYQVSLMTDMTSRLWYQGHEKVVRKWLGEIYSATHLPKVFKYLEEEAHKNGVLHVCLSPIERKRLDGISYFGDHQHNLDTTAIRDFGLDHAIAKHLEKEAGTYSFSYKKPPEPVSEEELDAIKSRIFMMKDLGEVTSRIVRELK